MQIGDLIKFQMMNMLNPSNSATGVGGKDSDIRNTIYLVMIQVISFFFMSVFEQLSTALPTVFEEMKKKYVNKRIESTFSQMSHKSTLADVSIKLDSKHEQSTVIIIRKWDSSNSEDVGSNESKEIADALLSYIANAENIPSIQLIQSSQFIMSYVEKPVEILEGIYIKIDDFKLDTETLKMQHLVFKVTSNIHTTKYIKECLLTIRKDWIADQQNKLGDELWYFEQRVRGSRSITMDQMSSSDAAKERARFEKVLNAPPVITYEMRKFVSNKSFDNLFGQEARIIRDRIDFFIEHPEWYAKKGLPYQLGLLLSGRPGSGKTAIIRALANRTKRHIINLKLSNLATATQLKNIFYNDYISVSADESGNETKKLLIPADKRIYVFEEIDTIGELVQERSLQLDVQKSVLQDELTLGDILQILDGTIEIPGRILIMTSNYPERLDRALLRPGRMDVKIDFGFTTAETIVEIINGMLDVKVDVADMPHQKLTVAEVLNIVFTFIHHDGDVSTDIIKRLQDRVKELEDDAIRLQEMKEKIQRDKDLEMQRLQAEANKQKEDQKDVLKKLEADFLLQRAISHEPVDTPLSKSSNEIIKEGPMTKKSELETARKMLMPINTKAQTSWSPTENVKAVPNDSIPTSWSVDTPWMNKLTTDSKDLRGTLLPGPSPLNQTFGEEPFVGAEDGNPTFWVNNTGIPDN